MSKARTPLPDPFDLALSEYYSAAPRMKRYRRLVELGGELGDPLAQYAMATWYLHGQSAIGIKRNPKKAVELLEACAPVFHRAAYDLAVSKLRGIGTRRDPKGAFGLFARAAHLGSLPALEEQARCLAAGIGTRRDLDAARFLGRRLARWKQALRETAAPRSPRRTAGRGPARAAR